MLKKIFISTVASLTIFIATQFNICGAMIAPYQMYLGGLTFGSKVDEMKQLHGEPDAIYNGIEGYATGTYGDLVLVHYNEFSGKIYGIDVTEDSLNWRGDRRIGVGMSIDEWLEWHAEPEKIKVGDVQTVYLYFHYKSDPVLHVTFRDYGLFIAFNNESGIITEMKIYGDNDMETFEETFDNVMANMLVPIEK